MRTLKDGTVKPKPSAVKAAEWMQQPPHPLPVFRKRDAVQVFMGAGWLKGTVLDSSRDRCTVWLGQAQRSTTVYDARNVRPYTERER